LNAPAIPIRAAKTLADLEESSVQVSHADVVWLVRLAERIERPAGDELGPLPGSPLVIGPVKFWPMTWLANDWFFKWHDILSESKSPLANLVFAYAHTMSEPCDQSLLELDSYKIVKKAVAKWKRSTPLNDDHLATITLELTNRWTADLEVPVPNPDKPESKGGTSSESSDASLAKLSSSLGGTPDYWRYGIPMSRTRAMNAALAQSVDIAGSAPDPHSPRIRAMHNYHQAVKWVIKNGQ
jgi:hypothetical protein